MEIRSRTVGGTIVFNLSGQLIAGPDATSFWAAIAPAAGKRVVLNFSQVTRLDCAGISELVRLHCLFAQARRSVILVGVPRRAGRLLTLCGLERVLSICDTEEEAIGEPRIVLMNRQPERRALVGLR